MPGNQLTIDDFILPFSGKLRADNRWVKLAQLIPWEKIEIKYAQVFDEDKGAPAKPLRMALGALIIKEKCRFSDEETVAQIVENPYLQYFIGLKEYQDTAPFDPSLMVHFRKRLDLATIQEINELIFSPEVLPATTDSSQDQKDEDSNNDNDQDQGHGHGHGHQEGQNQHTQQNTEPHEVEHETVPNNGKLILDATCAPADIRYPTDLSLLNEAREKLEAIIDELHKPMCGKTAKPRTYRQKARKDYLRISKRKKNTRKQLRKGIGQQLRYVARDLRIIKEMLQKSDHGQLNNRQQRELDIIEKLYQQQKTMYDQKQHRIEDRIVSISQPHVRPIVRGKTKAETEFGAKVAISLVKGYAFIDELSWDNFNEGTRLKDAVESYRKRFGCYPETVIADKIYRNRDNLRFCKELGIRLSGPPLGRPAEQERLEQRRLERQDARERNAVEGKFGEGKRCYGLGRIMARLKETSEAVIALQFLVMNLEHRLRVLFYRFFKVLFQIFNMLNYRLSC